MAATGIDIKILALLSAAVALIEVAASLAGPHLSANSLIITSMARTCQISAIAIVLFVIEGNLSAIGIRMTAMQQGLKRGLLWSAGFGLIAALAGVLLYAAGKDPTALVRVRLPERASQVVVLFAVGGIIGPIAEEMFFRGVLYGYFRRWGVVAAVVVSTGIFVLAHLLTAPMSGFVIIQAVGGLVFAASYELEKNLAAPVTIHCLGNMAIFALPAIG